MLKPSGHLFDGERSERSGTEVILEPEQALEMNLSRKPAGEDTALSIDSQVSVVEAESCHRCPGRCWQPGLIRVSLLTCFRGHHMKMRPPTCT